MGFLTFEARKKARVSCKYKNLKSDTMSTVISFRAAIENCTNLIGHKNEQKIREGNRFEFSVYGDELLVYVGNTLIWNEYIFMNDGKFAIA